ncbi:MAG: hypothetical protein ACD_43C00146G0002 [uncultured bacterium]|nr:MAG: hypothetical protein ACD_43C00146G0002 [uncultured bacterium]
MSTSLKSFFISLVVGLISGAIATVLVAGLIVLSIRSYPEFFQKIIKLDTNLLQETTAITSTAPTPILNSQEAQIISVVDKVKPAVVSVVATADVPVYEQYYENGDPSSGSDTSDPFGGMFGPFGGFNIPQYRQNGTQEQEVSSGSGFLVSADGYVVTNKHVVDQSEVEYTVITNDGTKYPATVVAKDPTNDIAILKIEGNNFSYLEFGDSDALQVGQTTIAIGNALGEFSNTVSVGIVSGLARSLVAGDGYGNAEELSGIIQTDAAINLGNSGGPLLNASGQVIGVNVAMAQAENIGFALPSNLVKSVFQDVRTDGKISRPWLGVRYVPVTAELKEKNSLSVDYGALILRGETATDLAVIPSSPADKAGLVENDIILELAGQKLDVDHDLTKLISQKQVGDKVTLKVLHDGKEKMVDVTLEERQ